MKQITIITALFIAGSVEWENCPQTLFAEVPNYESRKDQSNNGVGAMNARIKELNSRYGQRFNEDPGWAEL